MRNDYFASFAEVRFETDPGSVERAENRRKEVVVQQDRNIWLFARLRWSLHSWAPFNQLTANGVNDVFQLY